MLISIFIINLTSIPNQSRITNDHHQSTIFMINLPCILNKSRIISDYSPHTNLPNLLTCMQISIVNGYTRIIITFIMIIIIIILILLIILKTKRRIYTFFLDSFLSLFPYHVMMGKDLVHIAPYCNKKGAKSHPCIPTNLLQIRRYKQIFYL